VSSEVTEDAAVGQSQRFCVIKPQVCVQKYEYFMYDPKGSSPVNTLYIYIYKQFRS